MRTSHFEEQFAGRPAGHAPDSATSLSLGAGSSAGDSRLEKPARGGTPAGGDHSALRPREARLLAQAAAALGEWLPGRRGGSFDERDVAYAHEALAGGAVNDRRVTLCKDGVVEVYASVKSTYYRGSHDGAISVFKDEGGEVCVGAFCSHCGPDFDLYLFGDEDERVGALTNEGGPECRHCLCTLLAFADEPETFELRLWRKGRWVALPPGRWSLP